MSGKTTGTQPACRISYGFHFRVGRGISVDDDPAGCLSDDVSRSVDDHGSVGLVPNFDRKVPHFEGSSNKCFWSRSHRLFNVAGLRVSLPDEADQRTPSNG